MLKASQIHQNKQQQHWKSLFFLVFLHRCNWTQLVVHYRKSGESERERKKLHEEFFFSQPKPEIFALHRSAWEIFPFFPPVDVEFVIKKGHLAVCRVSREIAFWIKVTSEHRLWEDLFLLLSNYTREKNSIDVNSLRRKYSVCAFDASSFFAM